MRFINNLLSWMTSLISMYLWLYIMFSVLCHVVPPTVYCVMSCCPLLCTVVCPPYCVLCYVMLSPYCVLCYVMLSPYCVLCRDATIYWYITRSWYIRQWYSINTSLSCIDILNIVIYRCITIKAIHICTVFHDWCCSCILCSPALQLCNYLKL